MSSSSLTNWLEDCCGWREGSEKGEKNDTARWFNRNAKPRARSCHLPREWGWVHMQSLHPTVKPQHGMVLVLFSCWRLKIVGRWRSGCSLWGSGTSFLYVCVYEGTEGWRGGELEGRRFGGWRGGGIEGSYTPLLSKNILAGTVSCPFTLPSHNCNPKIHFSQSY